MRAEKFIDDLQIKLVVFDIIANEMKWKFANRFDVPLVEKRKIIQSYDEAVENLISMVREEWSVNLNDSTRLAKQIIDFYKSEAIKTNEDNFDK